MSALNQLYIDLFNTALEGGIGYWSECDEYHWANWDGTQDIDGFFAVIYDFLDDDKKYRIDRKVIARGYRLATTEWHDRISWSCSKPPLVVTNDTEWDFDASDADTIVQLGLFGNLVYG